MPPGDTASLQWGGKTGSFGTVAAGAGHMSGAGNGGGEKRADAMRAGGIIARILAGSWRAHLPPGPVGVTDAEVEAVVPQLAGCGAAALAARRLMAAGRPVPGGLRQAARRQAARGAARLPVLVAVVAALEAEGIAPLLIKGWGLGAYYAARSLRGPGDFDLVVAPGERARALAVLRRLALPGAGQPDHGQFVLAAGPGPDQYAHVDLHWSVRSSYGLDLPGLFGRAVPAGLPGTGLKVPAPEDHLRLVALHFAFHGGWRPLWLCDVAAMTEAAVTDAAVTDAAMTGAAVTGAAGGGFGWETCLSGDPAVRGWMQAVLGLGRTLLEGAVPAAVGADDPPAWVTRTVLAEWRAPYAARFRAPSPALSLDYPARKLRSYWVNPVAACFDRRAAPAGAWPAGRQAAYFCHHFGRAALKALSGGRRDG